MVYLDYAANTPVDERVLGKYVEANRRYFANPNANHNLGREVHAVIENTSKYIKELIGTGEMEVIYTSGASEANNLAVKGIARAYRENGKHIITTCVEHSSVSGALTWLQNQGYEIDLVDIGIDGRVDLKHLKELIRKDTILISICYVDSELGVLQPIHEIGELVAGYPNCFFHTDATQAVGKIPLHLENVDLVTFTPHKFYGLNGMGVLLRKKYAVLEPLVHGGSSTSIYRSGTPVVAWAESIYMALQVNYEKMNKNYKQVEIINNRMRQELKKYSEVRINSTTYSLPHFLNISVKGVKAEEFQTALSNDGIYVSTKSACAVPKTPSRAVFAVTRDKKNAMCSWRISISHLTTDSEAEEFMKAFEACYEQLKK